VPLFKEIQIRLIVDCIKFGEEGKDRHVCSL
jgi:hypothetical protein